MCWGMIWEIDQSHHEQSPEEPDQGSRTRRQTGRLRRYERPFQTGGSATLSRATRFRYNHLVVLVRLPFVLGTTPCLAACVLRGAACPSPIRRLSISSACDLTPSVRLSGAACWSRAQLVSLAR